MSELIASSSGQYVIGIPQNNGTYYDGTRYWVFYWDGTTLACKYGLTLASLASAGSTGLTTISNSGRMYSLVFGTISTTHYAWVIYNDATEDYAVRRWELTSSGLGTPIDSSQPLADRTPGHTFLSKNYGNATVSSLYGSMTGPTTDASIGNRETLSDLSANTGMAAFNPTDIVFPEIAAEFPLSDGFVCIAVDNGNTGEQNGNFGHCREVTKTLVGDLWGTEATIEGNVTGATANNGDFTDQNYSINSSHTGQMDITQLDSGEIYVAYCANGDLVNGNYGEIKLVKRGNTQASGWTLVSNDVIGANAEAWSTCVTTDGTDIWIYYVKDNAGVRDTAIYGKKYTVSGNSFGTEFKVADITPSSRFERMFSSFRSGSIPLVAYSETADEVNYSAFIARADGVTVNLNISITGIPDGTYRTVLIDDNDIVVFAGNLTYTSGSATAADLPVEASTNITGFVIDNEVTPADGAVITGTTV